MNGNLKSYGRLTPAEFLTKQANRISTWDHLPVSIMNEVVHTLPIVSDLNGSLNFPTILYLIGLNFKKYFLSIFL